VAHFILEGNMDNQEIIRRLWERDTADPKIVDMLYSMAVNTSDCKMSYEVANLCQRRITEFRSEPKKAYDFYEIYEKALKFASDEIFEAFLIFNELDRPVKERFYQPRMKQLKPIVDALQEAADGELDELFLSQPPRTGKSTIVQIFLVWYAKTHPEKANLYCSYAQGVVDTFYDGCLEFLTDPTYRLGAMFVGNDVVYKNKQDAVIDLRRNKKYKSITCKSLYGQLNGLCDCNGILIGDDLLSGIEEALNPDILTKANTRVNNNLLSRAKEGCVKIWIGTRWHPVDPIGTRINMIETKPEFANLRYKVVNVPALNENDESNFDYDYGVGFSTEYYHKLRAQFESADDIASWSAQYLGEPYYREGLLYPEEVLRRYFELPDAEPDSIIGICDTKDTGTDYAFLPVGYIYGKDVYIDDCVCDNSLPEVTDVRCAEILVRKKVQLCRFESNSAGGRIADKVNDIVKARGHNCHITKRFTTANKLTKIIQNSSYVKEHFLFRDRSVCKGMTDYNKMLKFLTHFTIDGKNKNDDVPDGIAMLAEYIESQIGTQIEVVKPFF
jgi:predicted phage terminase large subunit-like protein